MLPMLVMRLVQRHDGWEAATDDASDIGVYHAAYGDEAG